MSQESSHGRIVSVLLFHCNAKRSSQLYRAARIADSPPDRRLHCRAPNRAQTTPASARPATGALLFSAMGAHRVADGTHRAPATPSALVKSADRNLDREAVLLPPSLPIHRSAATQPLCSSAAAWPERSAWTTFPRGGERHPRNQKGAPARPDPIGVKPNLRVFYRPPAAAG